MRKIPRLSTDELAPYLLELPAPPDPSTPPPTLDWPSLFGNTNPVEIEVGCGKGLFLLTESQARPNVNFVGVEIERKYQLYAANRIAKRGLRNVRVARDDARLFLRDRVPAGSVRTVHVYFPDPWWKKRHHKRRVFTDDFVRQCARVLEPGGRLSVATDVAEYFQIIRELLTENPSFRELPPPDEHDPRHDMDYMTNYERKARKEGKPVYRAVREKVGDPGERGA